MLAAASVSGEVPGVVMMISRHARHPRRHRRHQHRGGIEGLPSRHVDSHPAQRRHPHTHPDAGSLLRLEGRVAFLFVEGLDPPRGMLQGAAYLGGDPRGRILPGFRRQFQNLDGSFFELERELAHRLVAPGPHGPNDIPRGLFDGLRNGGRPIAQPLQNRFKIRVGTGDNPNHRGSIELFWANATQA